MGTNYRESVFKGDIKYPLNTELTEVSVDIDASSVVRGRTASHLMRKSLLDYLNRVRLSPKVYEDILRSLRSNIKLYTTRESGEHDRIVITHGRQERAVANQTTSTNLIYPAASIMQSTVYEDPDKRRYEAVLMSETKWNEATQRSERVLSFPDVPVIAEYLLSVRTKYTKDMDQIAASLRSRFNPSLIITTPFSSVIKTMLNEENDISTAIVGDQEDRILERIFTIGVEFYIPSIKFKVTSTGKIEVLKAEAWILEE